MRRKNVGTQGLDFAEFYRQAKDECLLTVLVSVGDRDTAQDLVAEAFARAWASWRTVSRHPAPTAWVVRTALNAASPGGAAAAVSCRWPTPPASPTSPQPTGPPKATLTPRS